jgi:hypothetical protein
MIVDVSPALPLRHRERCVDSGRAAGLLSSATEEDDLAGEHVDVLAAPLVNVAFYVVAVLIRPRTRKCRGQIRPLKVSQRQCPSRGPSPAGALAWR